MPQLRSNAAHTHIFVQAGVGGLAASSIAGACRSWNPPLPRIVTAEPQSASCATDREVFERMVPEARELHSGSP